MSIAAALADRAMGALALSVGTSLALEGALGIHPDHEESPAPLLRYDELWCNVRTLFRNALGALDRTTAGIVLPEDMTWVLQEEMEQLTSLVAETTHARCRVVYYVSNYAGLAHRYPHATLRRDTTSRQKTVAAIQKDTIVRLLDGNRNMRNSRKPHIRAQHDGDDEAIDAVDTAIAVFDLKLSPVNAARRPPPAQPPRVLLLTHYPYDLFGAKRFSAMTLLESHTGRLKEKALWHTKYANGRELARIPFREDLIQVFGDAELFAPMRREVRHELVQIAQKLQWNATTTYERIALGVDLIRNPYAREVLRKIISSRY